MHGNQQRYCINKNSHLLNVLEPIPKYTAPKWRLLFKVLLTLRACIQRTENLSETTKVVELRNCLTQLNGSFQRLGLSPPPFTKNFFLYLESFNQWILDWTALLAEGEMKSFS